MNENKNCGLKVLITGSEGFTGKYMQDEMEAFGYKVYRSGTNPNINASNYFVLDLLNEDSIRSCLKFVRPDIIIHLAAIAHIGYNDIRQFYDVNIIGTRNLLAATAKLNIQPKSILIASSANVYGNNTKSVLSEEDAVYPANDYAVSKLAMEYVAKIWMNELPIIIVRPFNYTGVGQKNNFLIPKIVEHFKLRKKIIELGNINVYREFNDVRFVVAAYRELIEAGKSGFLCNICTGKQYSLLNIIDICKLFSGHHLEININPALIRKNEILSLSGDHRLLSNITKIKVSYELKDTLNWMLKN
ncbi:MULTISPECIES: NAD-dependent epimerase/dehydratase family protein [Snodgrassella]|uniref:NAD-dependent epimerase/dehydratase family protein n=1 Tax=Snodgrassella TaxID=1193515 RepID=UPI0008154ED0|nr:MULTISPECIES: NAD-dependent epimerase/dehydratase family protein [Snodgrassella]SCC01482.1 Nucleoside-diphosphate-sugar epimerase [Snodgrassella sp. R-53583]